MIRTLLWRPDQPLQRGGAEQIEQWRNLPDAFIWIDIYDEPDERDGRFLRDMGCHELAISDAQKERHPPKLELFGDETFLLLRDLTADATTLDFNYVQTALFARSRSLITRASAHSPSVELWWHDPNLPEVMARGSLFLMTRIAKTMGSRYLDLLLTFEPRLSQWEDELLQHTDEGIMRELGVARNRLRKLCRIATYMERACEELMEEIDTGDYESNRQLVHASVDLYEKFERMRGLADLYYQLSSDLIETHLSLSSHQLSQAMRLLTVLMSVFIPLTFVAGIYGMNFEHMPELQWQNGYFGVLGVMGLIAAGLLILFRRYRWV